jgi:hypothetical protein
VVSFLQVSPPKPCIRLSSHPYELHDPPISFFSIVTPYDTAEIYRRCELNCCPRLDGSIEGTFRREAAIQLATSVNFCRIIRRHIPEDFRVISILLVNRYPSICVVYCEALRAMLNKPQISKCIQCCRHPALMRQALSTYSFKLCPCIISDCGCEINQVPHKYTQSACKMYRQMSFNKICKCNTYLLTYLLHGAESFLRS